MLKVKRLTVGQLATNCYLVMDEATREVIIIDPGDDADYITRVISDLQAKPKAIVATHGHFDHILAVTELKLAYQIPFLVNKKDEFLLARMQDSARFFTHHNVDPSPTIDGYLEGGDKLEIGNRKLEITDTPGHTPGSISLYSKKDKALFCGDVVFAEGKVGRVDFSYSSPKELKKSLWKLLALPGETKVYSGHGVETTINEVKLYN